MGMGILPQYLSLKVGAYELDLPLLTKIFSYFPVIPVFETLA